MSLGKRKRRVKKHSTRKRRKYDEFVSYNTVPIDLSVKTRILLTSRSAKFRNNFVELQNTVLKGYSSHLFQNSKPNYYQYYQTPDCVLYGISKLQENVQERDEEEEEEDDDENRNRTKSREINEGKKLHNISKMKEFSDSFVSLYKLFQAGSVPFFYFVSEPYVHVLFLSSLVHGSEKVSIIIRCDPSFRDEFYRVLDEDLRIYYYEHYEQLSTMKIDNYSKIHHIFDYLLNEFIPSVVLNPKNNVEYPLLPILYSPIPFLNSTCRCVIMANYERRRKKKKKVHKVNTIRRKKKKKRRSSLSDEDEDEDDDEEESLAKRRREEGEEVFYEHKVEIKGMILPHTFNSILLSLLDKRIPFKLSACDTLEETKYFNILPYQTDQSQYEDVFWNRHLKMSQKNINWDKMKQFRSFPAKSKDFTYFLHQKYIDFVEFDGKNNNNVLIRTKSPKRFDLNNPREGEDDENENIKHGEDIKEVEYDDF